MLGNWSLGDYFKKEQIPWIFDFFTKELGLSKEKLWVSVFEGTKNIPKDTETFDLWRSLGIPEGENCLLRCRENWWSMSGSPENMPQGEIGGQIQKFSLILEPSMILNTAKNVILTATAAVSWKSAIPFLLNMKRKKTEV